MARTYDLIIIGTGTAAVREIRFVAFGQIDHRRLRHDLMETPKRFLRCEQMVEFPFPRPQLRINRAVEEWH